MTSWYKLGFDVFWPTRNLVCTFLRPGSFPQLRFWPYLPFSKTCACYWWCILWSLYGDYFNASVWYSLFWEKAINLYILVHFTRNKIWMPLGRLEYHFNNLSIDYKLTASINDAILFEFNIIGTRFLSFVNKTSFYSFKIKTVY